MFTFYLKWIFQFIIHLVNSIVWERVLSLRSLKMFYLTEILHISTSKIAFPQVKHRNDLSDYRDRPLQTKRNLPETFNIYFPIDFIYFTNIYQF